MKKALFAFTLVAGTAFVAHGVGQAVPVVDFEFTGDAMNVWVATPGEVVDVALLVGPHRQVEVVPSETVASDALSFASGAIGARGSSFVAHAIVLYAPADDPGGVVEYTARAFFLCEGGECAQTSYSNYMVGTGAARRTVNTEGERSIDFDLQRVGVSP